MNKNENRYFNTAIKMDNALIALLEKKEFEYITVKEICDSAGVNRSTFYLHYENTSDLLRETTQYILDKHFSYYTVDKTGVFQRLESCELKELIFITREYLTPYLTFIRENSRIFKLAVKQFQLMNMDEVYNRMFRYIFEPILKRFSIPEKARPFIMKFYLTGVFAVVMEWLENDCTAELDFVVKIITDLVLGPRDIKG